MLYKLTGHNCLPQDLVNRTYINKKIIYHNSNKYSLKIEGT